MRNAAVSLILASLLFPATVSAQGMRNQAVDAPKIYALTDSQFREIVAPNPWARRSVIVSGTLSATFIVVTFIMAMVQKRSTEDVAALQRHLIRHEYTARVYDEFYSPRLRNVVDIVYQISLKWSPDSTGRWPKEAGDVSTRLYADHRAYREAVISGWPVNSGEDFDLYFVDYAVDHFKTPIPQAGLTEHQALSVFLHFWSNLEAMIESQVVDEKLATSLFAPMYGYHRDFIAELRGEIEQRQGTASNPPPWIPNTSKLERRFYGT